VQGVSIAFTSRGGAGGAIVNVASRAALETISMSLAKEVAEAILWLLGGKASFATGGFINVSVRK
jgi:NAD(P)-dependent dehydrogenase (short-subunit alcohol dehydrogenase family)